MKKNLIIFILTIIIIPTILVMFWFGFNKRTQLQNKPNNPKNDQVINELDDSILWATTHGTIIDTLAESAEVKNIKLPETIFDKTMKIPGTSITFKYPSKGFYGLPFTSESPKIPEYKPDDELPEFGKLNVRAVGFEPDRTNFDKNKTAEYIELGLHIEDEGVQLKGSETLEEVMALYATNVYHDDLFVKKGKNSMINNHNFFIPVRGFAFTLTKDGLLVVVMNDSTTKYPESIAAYKNNEKLFIQILESIKFE